MTKITIIDAGPTLNFLSSGHKELLLAAVEAIEGELWMPEEVEVEVMRKARQKSPAGGRSKFEAAGRKLRGLVQANVITIMASSQQDPDLNRLAEKHFRGDVAAVSRQGKDSGEAMVIIHACRQQELGEEVLVLIDDGPAQRRARKAGVRTLIDTQAILIKCAKIGKIADPAALKIIYDRLRLLDDGLPRWAETRAALRDSATYGSEIAAAEPLASPDPET